LLRNRCAQQGFYARDTAHARTRWATGGGQGGKDAKKVRGDTLQ
jgi:hypothetical protein